MAWVGFITALVVFLLNVITPDTAGLVVDRLVDSLIGGAVALGAYLLWPTWSERDAEQSLAHLAVAERQYAGSVLAAVSGAASRSDAIGSYARRTRVAAANAEAAVTRSLEDPKVHRIDADRALGVLEGFRRVSESLHALRADLRAPPVQEPAPEARELAGAVDTAMASIAVALRSGGTIGEHPHPAVLRNRFAAEVDDRVTLVHTDRLVEAVGALMQVLRVSPATTGTGWC